MSAGSLKVALIVLNFGCHFVLAQHYVPHVGGHSRSHNPPSTYGGFVVTNLADTIHGRLLVSNSGIQLLGTSIKRQSIKSFRLLLSPVSGQDHEDYYSVKGNKRFFNLLFARGNTTLFGKTIFTNGH